MTQREDKERSKTARECLGKFFYDLAKTCFLIMVAGNAVTVYSDGELKIFNITSIIMVYSLLGFLHILLIRY